MALTAYLRNRTCPACSNPIKQSEKQGRDRKFCNDACKMRYHRRIKAQCPWCGHDGVLGTHPFTGETERCWQCGAHYRNDRDRETGKRTWTMTKPGKKALKLKKGDKPPKS